MKNDRPTDHGKPARRVFIKSFGCQMNVYDSQRMADVAAAEGYEQAASVEDADLIVLNTCHIRERASEKIYSELGKVRQLKDERASAGRETTLVVAGCVAQAEGAEILRRQPAVDIVVGPQNYHRLPQLLRAKRRGAGAVDTEFPLEDKFDHLPASAPEAIRARGVSAFVAVQEGCDKFCSFCVVPYTRGGEVSRPLAKVLAEIERLAGPASAKSPCSAKTSTGGGERRGGEGSAMGVVAGGSAAGGGWSAVDEVVGWVGGWVGEVDRLVE